MSQQPDLSTSPSSQQAVGRPEFAVNGWNSEYVDQLYRQWFDNPDSVDPQWRYFFQGFDLGYRVPSDGEAGQTMAATPQGRVQVAHSLQGKVDALIYHYRDIGHFAADLDPLGNKRPFPEYLTLASFDLSEEDLDKTFDPGVLPLPNPAPLRDIISLLQDTYCRHIGVEYMHIQDRQIRRWLQDRIEPTRNRPQLESQQKMRILRDLIEADAFENFINTRYRGQKRFGLDGGESLIPMLQEAIERGPNLGVKEFTLGMAHRGRLNVLANIMDKTYDQIFTEFEESWVEDFLEGGGDVKYHAGYSTDKLTTNDEPIRLTLSYNPSHLEAVDPVVLGRCRAKQRVHHDSERTACVPILMHGDAAFAGQGVVAETLNMANLKGYTVGGTIHIIINNQIGFTTDQTDSFSGRYCTDIAKMIEAPIFHVNGDDPEACTWVAQLALEFRQRFKRDVVIDMWCFRKYGHNESDEPTFTQPLMYEKIRKHQPVLKQYTQRLIDEGLISQNEADALYTKIRDELDESQTRTKEQPVDPGIRAFRNLWKDFTGLYSDDPVETAVSIDALKQVSSALGRTPENFSLHKRLARLLQFRSTAVEQDLPMDWAMGEMLAYGTLLLDGHDVRLTGQDVQRGTFSHRHAVLFDQQTNEPFVQLNNITDNQGRLDVFNSPLTEYACVGFEYGFSLADPRMLIIWEAQFGDFANGAQVMIDQFIASAEVKWQRHSGLVLFLPHGYEGQGPEHSSARLERWLTLTAQNNMVVCYPTTPAQHFHMLRQQIKRDFRKPLIVMTPKSMLRNPMATSKVADFTSGTFQRLLDDPAVTDPKKVTRVLLCTGKIYYELVAHREKTGRDDIAIVRVEQLYPLPEDLIRKTVKKYSRAQFVWVQEEPKNMGAWRYMDAALREHLDLSVTYVGRDANASPSAGSSRMHAQEQEKIMITAIGLPSENNGSTKAGKAKAAQSSAKA